MEQKSVFISYRRNLSKHLARSIYQDLRANGWDVFLDVDTIDSGDFDRIILNQIGARAHFILLVSPGALERCAEPGDWVLREIEEAVRLERNIVPILEEGADFSQEIRYLPDDLRAAVSKKNALPLLHFYFEDGMTKLRERFLRVSAAIMTTTPPAEEQTEAQRRLAAVNTFAGRAAADDVRRLIGGPFEWCEVPAGEFLMGHEDEEFHPPRKFYLPAFAIAKYPITYGQFLAFTGAQDGFTDPRWWQGLPTGGWGKLTRRAGMGHKQRWKIADHPAEAASWHDALAFCRWLSFKLGAPYDLDHITEWAVRLPTEYEWEKAARGTDGRLYPWGSDFDSEKCNTKESGIGQTTAVTRYPQGASPYGVRDMCGNVFEWCINPHDNPDGGLKGSSLRADVPRVYRGGCWGLEARLATTTHRPADSFNDRDQRFKVLNEKAGLIGFRIVCPL